MHQQTPYHSGSQHNPKQVLPTLSRQPEKAVEEIMATIKRLHSVYERENAALAKTDTKAFMALQEEKLNTAELYQHNIKEMIARKDEIKKVDPLLRKKLARLQADFTKIGTQNLKALERMKRCVDRLGGTLRTAAKEEAQKQHSISYGSGGKMHARHNTVVTTGSISETA